MGCKHSATNKATRIQGLSVALGSSNESYLANVAKNAQLLVSKRIVPVIIKVTACAQPS